MFLRSYKTGSRWAFFCWNNETINGKPYLSRFFFIKTPWFSVFLNVLHGPDTYSHLHDHPVDFLSLLLWGGYSEHSVYELYTEGGGYLGTTNRGIEYHSWYNWMPHTKRHRIISTTGKVVTLCFASAKRQDWGYFVDNVKVPWQVYRQQLGDRNADAS